MRADVRELIVTSERILDKSLCGKRETDCCFGAQSGNIWQLIRSPYGHSKVLFWQDGHSKVLLWQEPCPWLGVGQKQV